MLKTLVLKGDPCLTELPPIQHIQRVVNDMTILVRGLRKMPTDSGNADSMSPYAQFYGTRVTVFFLDLGYVAWLFMACVEPRIV